MIMKLNPKIFKRYIACFFIIFIIFHIILQLKSNIDREITRDLNYIPWSTLNKGSKLMSVSKGIFVGISKDQTLKILIQLQFGCRTR